MLLYQILAYTIHEKNNNNKKSQIRTINLKYQLQHRMKKVVLNISLKSAGKKTDNPSIRM